jgi:hypothetical protein
LEIVAGQVYFIADDFFKRADDPFLKIDYEQTKRPHYFAFKEMETSLYWLVPCSSRVEKFEGIIRERKKRRKPVDGIRLVMIQDKKTALLFQDMFPVRKRYIQEPYIRGGQPVRIADPKIIHELEKHAQKVISLLRHGVHFTPTQPDTLRIEKLMLDELREEENPT